MSFKYTTQDKDRFWSKVNRTNNIDDCWEWQGGKFHKGHGAFSCKGFTLHANRVAWELTNGAIPNRLNALHKCDNPSCCNPNHLFLGTKLDNNRDRHNKHRDANGERVNTAKLTAEQVLEIRRLFALGDISKESLARQFNVNGVNIGCIVRRKTWKHI